MSKRSTGFFFSVDHTKDGEMVNFVLSATCGRCGQHLAIGADTSEPMGKLDKILPAILHHSTECFVESGDPTCSVK